MWRFCREWVIEGQELNAGRPVRKLLQLFRQELMGIETMVVVIQLIRSDTFRGDFKVDLAKYVDKFYVVGKE